MNEMAAQPVYILVADLFFRSKIRAVAEAASVTVQFARSFDELQTLLPKTQSGAMIIIDLNDRSLRPLEILPGLAQAGHRLLGFLSHVDIVTANAARDAGCTVLPRSKFVENLAAILAGEFSG
jgi:hypothetical protein